jgi:hypothetical protein
MTILAARQEDMPSSCANHDSLPDIISPIYDERMRRSAPRWRSLLHQGGFETRPYKWRRPAGSVYGNSAT